MRRRDKEVNDMNEILGIVAACKVCRLAMAQGEQPFVLPLNYGYTWEGGILTLYFHSAKEGRKMEILRGNPRVCFEMDIGHGLIKGQGDEDCTYSYAFESIIGFGEVEFLEDPEEKRRALDHLMRHQTGEIREFSYSDGMITATAVYKVTASSFSAKRRELPAKSKG